MAAQPPLVLAVADHDLNHPLIDGSVRSDDLTLSFAHEQGLIPRPFTIEELFIPETLAAPGA
ncbi:MAG TPA: hypothetical protein VK066_25740 [Chloroflexota bacterium]|nr:hypothetical protein [Chloroflexota bacterium]